LPGRAKEALGNKDLNCTLDTEKFEMDVLGADQGRIGIFLLIFVESTLSLRAFWPPIATPLPWSCSA
jgi:hypothetical protein